ETQNRRKHATDHGQRSAGRVRNPAEVVLLQYLKSSLLPRQCIFVERGQVGLIRVVRSGLQTALEEWEAVVHIDHYAHTARPKQTLDVRGAIVLRVKAMTISEGVDVDDQIERAGQISTGRRGQVRQELFVTCDVE